MRFKFVHAADLHLDTPFSGIACLDPLLANSLRDASLDAWDALVDLVIKEKALFLLIAGDIYDGPDRGLRAQVRFYQGLKRLSQHGVRVFLVHGNHDPLEGWSVIRRWPEGVFVFEADRVHREHIVVDGTLIATIYGVSYARREESRNLAAMFKRAEEPGVHIGLLHCNATGTNEHGAYAPCKVTDLIEGGMDYWALGHVHRFTVMHENKPWVVYPGNLQGRSPAPGEIGPKGAVVVECDSESGILGQPRFVPLDRARFLRIAVDTSLAADTLGVIEAARCEMERIREEHPGRILIIRLELTGESACASDLAQLEATGELLDEIREIGKGFAPPIFCETVTNVTRLKIEREQIRSRGDFVSAVVDTTDGLAANPKELSQLILRIGEGLYTTKRGRLLPAPGSIAETEMREMLLEAEKICLWHLLAGSETL